MTNWGGENVEISFKVNNSSFVKSVTGDVIDGILLGSSPEKTLIVVDA